MNRQTLAIHYNLAIPLRLHHPHIRRGWFPSLNLDPDLDLFPPASPVIFLLVQGSSGAKGRTDVLAPRTRLALLDPCALATHDYSGATGQRGPKIGFAFRLDPVVFRLKSQTAHN